MATRRDARVIGPRAGREPAGRDRRAGRTELATELRLLEMACRSRLEATDRLLAPSLLDFLR